MGSGYYLRMSMLALLLLAGLASQLRPGMQLVYASAGSDQAPWVIDVVERGLALKGDADCAKLGIRRRAGQTEADESRLCVDRETLYAWDAKASGWIPQRPVGPNMQLTLPRPNGDTMRYETGALSDETIGAMQVQVVATTVTTLDSAGAPKRRLRERYAVALATATGGIFEVPDAAASTGWRTEQVFELRAIR
jgi:hypothetical protein